MKSQRWNANLANTLLIRISRLLILHSEKLALVWSRRKGEKLGSYFVRIIWNNIGFKNTFSLRLQFTWLVSINSFKEYLLSANLLTCHSRSFSAPLSSSAGVTPTSTIRPNHEGLAVSAFH